MATYTKLRDGSWGIRSTREVVPGMSVVVTKKGGEAKNERVARIIWTDGKVWLASIKPRAKGGGNAPRREDCRKYGWDGVHGSPSYYSSGQYDEDS
jgi:hypothetical protein